MSTISSVFGLPVILDKEKIEEEELEDLVQYLLSLSSKDFGDVVEGFRFIDKEAADVVINYVAIYVNEIQEQAIRDISISDGEESE